MDTEIYDNRTYYPCFYISTKFHSPNTVYKKYYTCSDTAYTRYQANKVIKREKKLRLGNISECFLVEKRGLFGLFSKFPKHVNFEDNMLEKVECEEECN